jgi:8-oxo-dGTP pyrophosphatase MutT (NUDIX family)
MRAEPTVVAVGDDELVEVVDAVGRVERVVRRAAMRADRLRHRCVYVVVRRPEDGAVLAHQRAAWKDVWPSRWDLAFGGVCGVGEVWVDAAVREVAEEAGIEVDPAALEPVGGGAYEDEDVAVVGKAFVVRHGGPFTFADGEVQALEWVAAADLDRWLARRDTCPDTLALASGAWLR